MSVPLLLRGDARSLPLADASVDLIVTSPPYFGLRSYTDGGRHYDGQLGAEASPREFIDALVACTAEWVRVLKPSGSIFVNLGDRFSNGDRFDNEFTVEDAAWLGGVIDSDGSISVHKQGTSYTAWVRVGQTRREVVERIATVTGTGTVCEDARGVWNWQAAAQQAAWVLRRIWPWLHIKRRQALAGVELQERKAAVGGRGRWNALTDAELDHRERLRQAVLAWNRGDADGHEPPLLPLPDLPMTARRIPPKSLSLLPERYRVACVDELGLIARAVIVWSKPNGLPESVQDRVRRSHEDWVHLTRQPRYFAAVDEIREPHTMKPQRRFSDRGYGAPGSSASNPLRGLRSTPSTDGNPLGKLPGSVWEIATQPLKVPAELGVDHFAAFPMEWPRRLILGWSPREVCTACGEGRQPVTAVKREVDRYHAQQNLGATFGQRTEVQGRGSDATTGSTLHMQTTRTITGYACACLDTSAPSTPGVVLDPFGGTGTTALVATMLGRRGISVDLSADYCRLAGWRTSDPKQRERATQVPKPRPARLQPAPALFEQLIAELTAAPTLAQLEAIRTAAAGSPDWAAEHDALFELQSLTLEEVAA